MVSFFCAHVFVFCVFCSCRTPHATSGTRLGVRDEAATMGHILISSGSGGRPFAGYIMLSKGLELLLYYVSVRNEHDVFQFWEAVQEVAVVRGSGFF